MSDICYDRFNRAYYCNNNGLSNAARIGIGIGIAAAVILLFSLCGWWRRKQLQKQFARYRPPAPLPYAQSSDNPYASNPPPPQTSSFGNNQYGSNPPPPPATYQPSMAGQYTGQNNGTGASGRNEDGEHGYEWEQAREAERLEREQQAGGNAPPGYDMSNTQTPVVTGNATYAPPPGAPPPKR